MKKWIALLLAALLVFSLAACSNNTPASDTAETGEPATTEDTAETAETDSASDKAYVQEKGTLIVGITDFAPMDYQENGEWIGFDADMAKAFAESLGVEAQFVEINWDTKAMELDSKNIDCVWNGMTLTEETTSTMSCSNAYCNNAQVVVVKSDKAEGLDSAEACMDLNFAVESGSAGEAAAVEQGFNYIAVDTQADALMEVTSGTSDACIIDLLMAGAMIGEGTNNADLVHTVELTTEEYGVGFRQGSDLTAALNEFFAAAYADGSMMACAETYGVQDAVIAQ
ncbi:MAG TPA: transporter substrate-binding domain-containing protein [Candidatus Avoscillospira avicola]|uniref:Transporter substrate-binding domain-containing protein n=1 Tax=Candidatus Avoscillospira avicola TaxID=2840706 RepID=A0A9D1ARM6_9FIRM|nr:transporter substrate-binding domain-containing protein [Candidatus Avoscillospira avicola]